MQLRKFFKRITLGILCLCLISTSLISTAYANKSTIDAIIDRGTLRVGFSSFVPWAMQDKNGEYIGFEIDVAKRLAEDLGVKLQLIPTNWDGIIPALMARKFDVIIGGMTATTKRALSVNFTIPYDYIYMDVVMSKKSGGNVKTFADLNNPKTIIALRSGSSASMFVKANLPKATVRMFNDEAPAVQEVISGRANAFLSASPLPKILLAKNPKTLVHRFDITTYKEPIAFAVRKNDMNTINVFDTWIRQQEGIGWFKARRAYWFDSNTWGKLLK